MGGLPRVTAAGELHAAPVVAKEEVAAGLLPVGLARHREGAAPVVVAAGPLRRGALRLCAALERAGAVGRDPARRLPCALAPLGALSLRPLSLPLRSARLASPRALAPRLPGAFDAVLLDTLLPLGPLPLGPLPLGPLRLRGTRLVGPLPLSLFRGSTPFLAGAGSLFARLLSTLLSRPSLAGGPR
ncbi:MAG: hypothetical protein R3181_02595 [Rubricoccaceae bacterium]|nr:hypothetical protein [Rubricoccaceae bacterium]